MWTISPNICSVHCHTAWDGIRFEEISMNAVCDAFDQQSELTGGYCDRLFKVPNPFYFIQ
jgi:hypothetical protein